MAQGFAFSHCHPDTDRTAIDEGYVSALSLTPDVPLTRGLSSIVKAVGSQFVKAIQCCQQHIELDKPGTPEGSAPDHRFVPMTFSAFWHVAKPAIDVQRLLL